MFFLLSSSIPSPLIQSRLVSYVPLFLTHLHSLVLDVNPSYICYHKFCIHYSWHYPDKLHSLLFIHTPHPTYKPSQGPTSCSEVPSGEFLQCNPATLPLILRPSLGLIPCPQAHSDQYWFCCPWKHILTRLFELSPPILHPINKPNTSGNSVLIHTEKEFLKMIPIADTLNL